MLSFIQVNLIPYVQLITVAISCTFVVGLQHSYAVAYPVASLFLSFFFLCLAPKSILVSVILLRGFSKLRFTWLKLVLIAAQSCFVEGSKLLVSPHAMSRLFKLQRYSCFTYTTPLFLLYIVCLAPKSCSNRAYFIYT